MPYILGIDIGTSFTAAAIAHLHPGRALLVPLNLGPRDGAAPSVVFLGRSGEVLVGEAAESRGLGNPDRIVRDFKRRIGDDATIVAGDTSVAPEDLFATIARWVVDRAVKREGAAPDRVTVSHPATWGPAKKALVHTALAKVGLTGVTLMSELEAAALHYATQEPVAQGKTVAVYDLGGGGFDVAVLRRSGADGFEGLGRPEGSEQLGGADFDDAVFRHVTASVGATFPGQHSPDSPERRVQVALARIRRECVEAKETLSFDSEVSIPVFLPGVQTHVVLTRSEFEALVQDSVQETIGGLNRALAAAEVAADDLATILVIGGSSRIPLVAQMLSEQVKTPLALGADPKASVSLGAALAGATAFLAVNQVDEPKPEDVAVRPVAPAISLNPPLGAGIAAFAATGAAPARAASSQPPSNPPVPITAARSRLGVGIAAAATVAVTVAALALTAGTTSLKDPDASGATALAQGNAAPAPAITGAPTPTPTPKSTASPKRSKQPVDPGTWTAPRKSSTRSSTAPSTAQPAPVKKTSRSPSDPTQSSSPQPPSTSTPRPPSTSTPTPTPIGPGTPTPTPTPTPTRPGTPTPTPTPVTPGPTPPPVSGPTPPPPVAGPTPAPPVSGPIPPPVSGPTPPPPPVTTPPAPAPEPTLAPPAPEPTTPAPPEPEPTLAPPTPEPEPTLAPPTPEPTTPAPPAPTPTPPETSPPAP